jgi:hypothetical protein
LTTYNRLRTSKINPIGKKELLFANKSKEKRFVESNRHPASTAPAARPKLRAAQGGDEKEFKIGKNRHR